MLLSSGFSKKELTMAHLTLEDLTGPARRLALDASGHRGRVGRGA